MAFETTMTEREMDANAQQFLEGLRGDFGDVEPDLAVDGLSESILSRVLGLFGVGKS